MAFHVNKSLETDSFARQNQVRRLTVQSVDCIEMNSQAAAIVAH